MVEPPTARQGRVGYPALAHLHPCGLLATGDWWGQLPSHPISSLQHNRERLRSQRVYNSIDNSRAEEVLLLHRLPLHRRL